MKTNKRNLFYQNTAPSLNVNIIKKILISLLWLIGGIMAGRLTLLKEINVGSLSYIVASSFSANMIPAFIGSMLGRLFSGSTTPTPLELIPEIICFTVLFLLNIIKYRPKRHIFIIIAAISRLPLLALTSITLFDIVNFFISTSLLVGCTICFLTSLDAVKKQDIKDNLIFLVASCAILISGLPGLVVFDISLHLVLASIIIMLSAAALGSAHAGAAGAIVGLSLALSGNGSFELGGMLAICGMLAGVVYNYGKLTCVPVYIAASIVLSLLYKNDVYYLMNWQTLLSSALVVAIIPNSFIFQLTKQITIQEKIQRWRSIEGVSKKILQLANCLNSLKNVFDDISLDETQIFNNNAPVLQEINQRSCKNCKKEKDCWEKNLYNTYRVLGNVVSAWDESSPPDTSKIPKTFIEECISITELFKAIDEAYNLYIVKSKMTKRIVESKKLIKNHLQGGNSILKQMSEEVSENFLSDQERIYKALSDANNIIYPINEKNGEYNIRCKPCGSMGTCHMYARKISKAMDIQHTIKARRCGSSTSPCNVCIAPVEGLDVFYSVAQKAKSGALCGDAFAMTHLASGSHLVAVADGMGSGPRASLEAKAAIELLREFLNTGFDEDTVFSIINRALLLRSGTETFAALDACIINPVDRYYRFLKVGAPASYIYRKGDFIKIQSPSMPLGIMENADCACIQREAYPGDVIILASDGFNPESLTPEIMEKNTLIKKLPRTLLGSNKNPVEDDVTIVTAKIKSPPTYSRRSKQLDEWKLRVASGAN